MKRQRHNHRYPKNLKMKGPNPPEKRLRKIGELAKVATEYDSTNHNIDDLYPQNWG